MRCLDALVRLARARLGRRLLEGLLGVQATELHVPVSESRVEPPGLDAVLFLDFDGVLHPRTQGTFRAVPLLQAWLERQPHVSVVVSSNWRMSHSVDALRALFETPLAQRIVDAVPFEGPERRGDRQRLIEAWLNAHSVRTWVALDDDVSLFEPGCPWLVCTQTEDGLTARELAQLDERLADAHLTR